MIYHRGRYMTDDEASCYCERCGERDDLGPCSCDTPCDYPDTHKEDTMDELIERMTKQAATYGRLATEFFNDGYQCLAEGDTEKARTNLSLANNFHGKAEGIRQVLGELEQLRQLQTVSSTGNLNHGCGVSYAFTSKTS